jgi:hypothetical protein
VKEGLGRHPPGREKGKGTKGVLISVLWLCKLKQEEERINQGETPWTPQGIVMAVSKRVIE